MYLPDTKSMVLQTKYGDEQYNTLNINDLGGIAQYIIPFNLLRLSSVQVLTYNLLRCRTMASDGFLADNGIQKIN